MNSPIPAVQAATTRPSPSPGTGPPAGSPVPGSVARRTITTSRTAVAAWPRTPAATAASPARVTATASPARAVAITGAGASPARATAVPTARAARLATITSANACSGERPPRTACQPRFCQIRACRNRPGPIPASGSRSTAAVRPPRRVRSGSRPRAHRAPGQGGGQRDRQPVIDQASPRPRTGRPGGVGGQPGQQGQPEPAAVAAQPRGRTTGQHHPTGATASGRPRRGRAGGQADQGTRPR